MRKSNHEFIFLHISIRILPEEGDDVSDFKIIEFDLLLSQCLNVEAAPTYTIFKVLLLGQISQ